MDSSGKRTSNFSTQEVNLLILLVRKYQNILECKKSDSVTWRQKEDVWQQLTVEFNGSEFCKEPRSYKALKGKWENLKKNTKKKFAAEKEEIYKTGGGTGHFPTILPQDDDIKSIIGVAVTGLQSEFDSDYIEDIAEVQNNIEIIFEDTQAESLPSTSSTSQDETVDPQQDNWTLLTPMRVKRPFSRNILGTTPSSKFKRILQPVTSLESKKDENIKIIQSEENQNNEAKTIPTEANDWAAWTPMKLKRPVSKGLAGKESTQKRNTKSKLTEDCRMKINCVSEARLDLLKLQTACLTEDQKKKEEEHMLKIAQMKELHLYEIEKKKLELEILKKQLQSI